MLTKTKLQGNVESFPLNLNLSAILQDEMNTSVNNRSRYILETSVHHSQVRNLLTDFRSCVMISDDIERLSPFVHNLQVWNQNLSGSRSTVNNIDNMERSVHDSQIRKNLNGSRYNIMIADNIDRILPLACNLQVRNQNLSGSRSTVNNIYGNEVNSESRSLQQGKKLDIVGGVQVLDSDRLGLDLTVIENTRENYLHTMSKQINTEFNDEPDFTYPCDLARRSNVLDSRIVEADISIQGKLEELNTQSVTVKINNTQMWDPTGIDFSKPMTQLLESLGDLNSNVKQGFNVVSAYSNNWNTTMRALLANQEERVSRL